MKYPEESNPKSRLMLSKGWGRGENEELLLNEFGVSFWSGKMFWKYGKRWWLYNIVNVPNATELFTLK